jgi:hypothetical protein
MMAAVLLWVWAAAMIVGGSGYYTPTGNLKGADFVHFYSIGKAVLTHQTSLLYDFDRLHQFQSSLVPESAQALYQPVYGPQTALLFALFAWLPYGLAAVVWGAVAASLYAWVVASTWRPVRAVFPDRAFVIAAAAAFPPFWTLVLVGQTTVVPLVGLFLTWKALQQRRRFLAGLAVGLFLLKPQLGLVFAAVILLGGEWAMLAGVTASAAIQMALVVSTVGRQVLVDYVDKLRHLPELVTVLEPYAFELHSLRALTDLFPAGFRAPIWFAASVIVVWQVMKVWRSAASLEVRLGIVVLGSLLVDPHLVVYDMTLLALPVLWLGTWIEREGRQVLRQMFWPTVYWLYVTLLWPTAAIVRIQASALLLLWMFGRLTYELEPQRTQDG